MLRTQMHVVQQKNPTRLLATSFNIQVVQYCSSPTVYVVVVTD